MTDRLWKYPRDTQSIGTVFNGGGSVIFPGSSWEAIVPFAFYLLGVRFIADTVGNFRVNIKTQPFATYFAGGFVDIHASAPYMGGNDQFEDVTLTGYTTAFDAYTCIQVVADVATTVTKCTVVLDILRG